MRKFRYLLSDFDGVIVDTEIPLLNAELSILSDLGYSVDVELMKQLCLLDTDEFIAFFESQGLRARNLAIALRNQYDRIFAKISLIDGFLNSLPILGNRWNIVTNQPRETLSTRLISSGLPSAWAKTAITRDDVSALKPNPDLYLEGIRKCRVNAQEIVAVEDSPHGVIAARSAGLFVLGMTTGIFSAEELESAGAVVIKDWNEISIHI